MHPFQRVTGQALIGAALPDEPLKILPAGLAFAFLNGGRRLGELIPGGGGRKFVFFQQVLAVVEQPDRREPGHGHQATLHGVVGDDGRKMLLHLVLGIRREVQQMLADDAGPDHVHHHHVHVG